jgi:hypothetical protein
VQRGEVGDRFNVLWGLFQRDALPVIERLTKAGKTVVAFSSLLQEPLMNGIFKRPDLAGRGTRLINVFDLYGDTAVDLDMVERLDVTERDADRFKVAEGDLFFTRSSLKPEGVGWTAYLENTKEQAVFECHVIRARVNREICVPGFLSNYARSWLAREYLVARASVTTMATIDQGAIGGLPVVLPDPQVQGELLAALNVARAKRRAKEAEADKLLAGLDDYLLVTLGLPPPPKDERRAFAVSRSALGSQARLNADYFHPERVLALRALEHATDKLDAPPLEQVVNFIRDQIKTPGPNYLSLANVQSNTGALVSTNEVVTGACSVFQRGDVLFARLRPYLNKVHAAETAGCCSPEFHVLRVKNNETLRPDYLAAILRSSLTLAQTRHMMTGNTHPRLTNEDVVSLVIPVPKPVVQEAIAAEARRRRDEARRLRAEADSGWQAAKLWFEEQLLGPAPP